MKTRSQLFAGISLIMGNKIPLSIDAVCIWCWCLVLLFVPIQWAIGWTIAALIHEAGHVTVLCIWGIKIHAVRIGILGAKIETEPISPAVEAICAVCGPVAGLLTILLREALPYIAVSALVQSAYNLLPVFPLDGGRAMNALLNLCLPSACAAKISRCISIFMIVITFVCGIYISVKCDLGFLPILFPGIPLIFTVRKNSLHCGQKNSTIRERLF